ncbi:MAG: hypothetical protein R2788_16355 [Saprospiraceae bacterium]
MARILDSHLHQKPYSRGKHGTAPKGDYPLYANVPVANLIHSRSGNAKWLYEISNRNLMHTGRWHQCENRGLAASILTSATLLIVWVTEAAWPGVIACSHHLGRYGHKILTANRWATATVEY